ncbi:MAG: hypothetical protein A2166_06250 [Omnitrophica WOR_2 bacterium RBG_13_41_10]|nr:MAG: hypothetical protein A2166_06250 [Omnitrophica WOR_2 bacterium RBG_13_41_10]
MEKRIFDTYYYIDEQGYSPVKEFIFRLNKKEKAKIKAYINELRMLGHNLRRPMADYLGEGIYELRPKHNRVFYFFYLRTGIVFVHAIHKKTKKIPPSDIQICLKRKNQIELEEKYIEKTELEVKYGKN